jgi:hypothetical protein
VRDLILSFDHSTFADNLSSIVSIIIFTFAAGPSDRAELASIIEGKAHKTCKNRGTDLFAHELRLRFEVLRIGMLLGT